MVTKIKPKTEVNFDEGIDGRDSYYKVDYYCPTCRRKIAFGYKSETACDNCGTFYDWPDEPARIIVTREPSW